jgi:hypothetical protein
MCKSKFRTWKLKVGRSRDAGKAAKREKQNTANRRMQRKKHVSIKFTRYSIQTHHSFKLKVNRLNAVDEYKKRHERDPTALIETDWMSTEVSSAETDDENGQITYRTDVGKAAGLSVADIREGQVAWEVVKPAWRSEMVSIGIIVKHCLPSI